MGISDSLGSRPRRRECHDINVRTVRHVPVHGVAFQFEPEHHEKAVGLSLCIRRAHGDDSQFVRRFDRRFCRVSECIYNLVITISRNTPMIGVSWYMP